MADDSNAHSTSDQAHPDLPARISTSDQALVMFERMDGASRLRVNVRLAEIILILGAVAQLVHTLRG